MLGRRQFVGAIGAAGVAAPFAAPSVARAQAWPPSRVTVVVPFPAGAATDIGARVYAEQLTALWGQPVVVDNKGGGNGIPAAESVARAKPDGLTLFATSAIKHLFQDDNFRTLLRAEGLDSLPQDLASTIQPQEQKS